MDSLILLAYAFKYVFERLGHLNSLERFNFPSPYSQEAPRLVWCSACLLEILHKSE